MFANLQTPELVVLDVVGLSASDSEEIPLAPSRRTSVLTGSRYRTALDRLVEDGSESEIRGYLAYAARRYEAARLSRQPPLGVVRLYKSRWQAVPQERPPARRVDRSTPRRTDPQSLNRRMRVAVRSRWDAFWFEPSTPTGLAICRVLFFGAFLLYFLRIDYRELGDVPPHAWRAVWPFAQLGISLPSVATLNVMQWLWRGSMFAACIGFAWRWASLAAFILGLYLVGLPENVASINHSDAIVVLGLGVMALSRAADGLSVDTLLERTANRATKSGEYTWPIRAMWVVFVDDLLCRRRHETRDIRPGLDHIRQPRESADAGAGHGIAIDVPRTSDRAAPGAVVGARGTLRSHRTEHAARAGEPARQTDPRSCRLRHAIFHSSADGPGLHGVLRVRSVLDPVASRRRTSRLATGRCRTRVSGAELTTEVTFTSGSRRLAWEC